MFAISSEKLNPEEFKTRLNNPGAGALVTFEGWVRNHNEGKDVILLEYEAYETLAEKEAKNIFSEISDKFEILGMLCIHRVGKLEIGEIAVWVGVVSAHRENAFKACQYIIDHIKVRLPIWKKEYYVDGDSGWVNCDECSKHVHH